MTGSSTGRTFIDFDCHRNQEWLRRRKLRLEQVRKQSDEIAKTLRQKVIKDEKVRLEEYDRISEAKFRNWKFEKLNELEKKLRCALEKFGEGYKESEAELVPEAVIEERYKINLAKAQKRGEIAKQEELKKKKLAADKRTSFVQRKIMTRKREDLRSALVRSIPLKKQLIDSQEVCEKNDFLGKVTMKKLKKKTVIPQKSCTCNQKTIVSKMCNSKVDETVWINLNDIKTNSSAGDSGVEYRSSKSSTNIGKSQKEKSEGTVEFYDFSSRYHSKFFKEFPHLVEKIDPESQMLNANELAEIEVEKEKKEMNKKTVAQSISQERGMEAIRREKIKRDYNNLITKLEELNKKEKILKTQQRIPLSFLHMNNERLSEKIRMKQRIMETEFERIYFETTARIPETELSQPIHSISRKEQKGGGGGDYVELDDLTSLRLSFSSSNLKPNSCVTSEEELLTDSPKKAIKTKKRSQLLLNIDKALKEGRKLRKTISKSREAKVLEDDEEKSSSDSKVEIKSIESSSHKDDVTVTKNEKLQVKDLTDIENSAKDNDLNEIDKTGDDSLPVSTSTSYKSPPSVIRSYRLRRILEYLEVNEIEDNHMLESNTTFKKKLGKLLHDLVYLGNYSKSEENNKNSCASPTLEYYIEKLLNMSRECIANLSVTSENVSTPNITELDVKDEKAPETKYFCESSLKEDELFRKSKLERADYLEETIKNWRKILGKNSEELQSEPEDIPDGLYPESGEDEARSEKKSNEAIIMNDSKIKSKYEEITKKCSARILELSKMLDQVRRDKENLLSSASNSSNLSLCKEGRVLDEEFDPDEEGKVLPGRKLTNSPNKLKTSPVLEDFISRYNLIRPRNETVSNTAVVDSQSLQDPEDSLESWPDVMDELLRKEILTSPFKWSDGDYSSEILTVEDQTEPSSIKTVIGNFRKEINKIKPSSLSDELTFHSFQQSNVSIKPRQDIDEKYHEVFHRPSNGSFPHWGATGNGFIRKENSVESINHALTSLGLNWAKSFLKKNQESRAMSSSSNSEEKCPVDEEDNVQKEC